MRHKYHHRHLPVSFKKENLEKSLHNKLRSKGEHLAKGDEERTAFVKFPSREKLQKLAKVNTSPECLAANKILEINAPLIEKAALSKADHFDIYIPMVMSDINRYDHTTVKKLLNKELRSIGHAIIFDSKDPTKARIKIS